MSYKDNKKGKFNAIDALIILLVLLCISGIVYRAFFTNGLSAEYSEYKVEFKLQSDEHGLTDYMTAGDEVRLTDGSYLGVLDEITVNPQTPDAYTEGGDTSPSVGGTSSGASENIIFVGSLTVKGKMTEQGLWLPCGEYIAPNTALKIHTERATAEITVTDFYAK